MKTYLSQDVSYTGTIRNKLRDLEGKETLAFELIQNADDDGSASFIRFRVTDEALIVDHDGQFTDCGDLEGSDCYLEEQQGYKCDFHRFKKIAGGGKRSEENTTGVFGIGFISVYQVTDRPELYSSDRHWTIRPDADDPNKRIEQEKLDSPVEGTRFYLPWATDSETELRQELGTGAISDSYPADLAERLATILPDSLLFLRHLTKIELCWQGDTVVTARRESDGDRRRIVTEWSDGETDNSTYLLRGRDFSSEAEQLIEGGNSESQEEKAPKIEIAIPVDFAPEGRIGGRYYAYLPTRHSTGLPFHVQADFFPSTDRRRIVFDGEFRNDWNRLATCQAYEEFVSSLPELKEEVDPERFWKILNEVFQANSSVDDLDAGPVAECWKKLKPVLEKGEYVYTEKGRWRAPDVTYYPVKGAREIEPLDEVLNILNIEIPASEIWRYQNLLRKIGTQSLGLDTVLDCLESIDIEEGTPKEEAPEWVRNLLGSVFQLLKELYDDSRKSDKQKQRLRKLPLALSTDGRFYSFEKAKKTSHLDLVDPLNTEYVLLNDDLPSEVLELDSEVGLIEELGVRHVFEILREIPETELDNQWKRESSPLVALIKKLLQHDALRKKRNCRKRKQELRELPIWPVGSKYSSLRDVVIPGGFSDPLSISRMLGEPAVRAVGPKLKDVLNVPRLNFKHYVLEEIPRAFNNQAIDEETRREITVLLSDRIGRLKKIPGIQEALSDCSIVLCKDQKHRRPEEVYFDEQEVREVLEEEVAYVAEDLPHPAAEDLYDEIGVASTPRAGDIVERVRSLTRDTPSSSARRKVKKVINDLGDRWKDRLDEFTALKRLEWLPAKDDNEDWHSPGEVFTPEKKHLFSSQAKFVDVKNRTVARPVFRFLDLESDPSTEQIVDHLLHLVEKEKHHGRFEAIYKELTKRLRNGTRNDEKQISRLKEAATIHLSQGKFCRPGQVFRSENPFGRFRHRITDEREYAPFLDYVGVKQEYDEEDAVAVLREIADEYGRGNVLRKEDRAVWFKCWGVCQSKGLDEDRVESMQEEPVVLNTRDSLVEPSRAFFDDHPYLPPVIEEFLDGHLVARNPEIEEVLRMVGVRSVRDVLSTRLAESPRADLDEQQTRRLHERIPLIRRVLNGELDKGSEVDTSRIENVGVFRSPGLSVVTEASALGEVVSSNPESREAFFDPSSDKMYVTRENGDLAWTPLASEIASFLVSRRDSSRSVASALVHVLSAPSIDSARRTLDQLGFPELRSESYGSVGRHETISLGGGTDVDDEQDEDADSSSEVIHSRENGESSPEGEEVDESKSEIEKEELGSPLEEERTTPEPTQSEGSASEQDSSGEGDEEGESTEREVKATTEESSSGSDEETGKISSKDDKQTESTDSEHDYRSSKLRTYVSKTPTQGRKGQTGNATDPEINKSGVDCVLKYEREQGREPEEQDHYNPGFDILSYDENGQLLRYIEVKSTNGLWDGYGVGLSSKQFEHAQEKEDDYWLYVVEHAKSDSPEVTCIQDPASRVDEYRFDDEWKQVEEDV